MNKTRMEATGQAPESAYFTSGNRSENQARPHPETESMLHAISEITATLRYYQAFGDPQDLDESICSLIALEAQLQQFARNTPKPQQKH